jgi:hypothetical protein
MFNESDAGGTWPRYFASGSQLIPLVGQPERHGFMNAADRAGWARHLGSPGVKRPQKIRQEYETKEKQQTER